MRTLLCGALCSGFFGYAFHFLDFVHGGGCRSAVAVPAFALGICLFVPGDFTELADRNSGKEIAAKHDVQNRKNMIITLKNCIAEEQYQIIQLEEELYNIL